jgi:hypothetical protein
MNVHPLQTTSDDKAPDVRCTILKFVTVALLVAVIATINALVVG